MGRLVLKFLYWGYRNFLRILIIYFHSDTTMKIKKKHFCRNAYIPVTEQFPQGLLISLIPEPP